jgi:vacuolar-type H+-ATPase subunit I/STV1
MKKSKMLVLLSSSCTLFISLINFSFLSISLIVYLFTGIWNPEHPKSLFNLQTSFMFSWFKILFCIIVLSMSSSFINFYRVSKVRPNLSVVTLEKFSGSFIAS